MTTFEQKRDAFHAHLDQCIQCRNRPLNLCVTGQRLLQEVADLGATTILGNVFPSRHTP